jgi:hypothetical protein
VKTHKDAAGGRRGGKPVRHRGNQLRKCELEADAVRRKIEAVQRPGPTKAELLARAKAKGLDLSFGCSPFQTARPRW